MATLGTQESGPFREVAVTGRKYCNVTNFVLNGHSQLMHMRIRYLFLADLHVTRHASETESERRIRNTQNKPCKVELVTRP